MKTLKVGDIVYLKNVGFPYNRTDNGMDSWEGASCVVEATNTGVKNAYISVRPILPLRADHGHKMSMALFSPEHVIREDRPWLKKHLKEVLALKRKLIEVARFAATVDL